MARRLAGLLLGSLLMSEASAATPAPAFRPAPDGGFAFDTGVLRGRLRAGGKSIGLSAVVHTPTGARLDRSMGLLSHYRVFTTGARYGAGAWDWPSTARLRDDGAVEIRWPDAADRPFELRALCRWSDAATLDVETAVTARRDLPAFESYLASYFNERFTNAAVCAPADAGIAAAPQFLRAEQRQGAWQMFPRDDAAVALIQDGRWKLEPHPVEWVLRPRFSRPLAVRRDPATGLTAAVMAPRSDCFAVSLPFETEGHFSLYLSLFGRDVKAGETARARARLVIGSRWSDARLIELHDAYARSFPGGAP
jgi:hypothetical protein